MSTLEAIQALQGEMTAWRRDIHKNPEIGFQEMRTASIVADLLETFGFRVHRNIGRTGVVGQISAGRSSRAIGLRADMDALPISEANDFEHRSGIAGVMHACGHDGHTASLLGAAKYLASTRRFDGIVNVIFQPAEEGLGGATAMIDDGLFTRFPCDEVFGLHNEPNLGVGKFALRSDAMLAGGAFFDVTIRGKGAHAGTPEQGVDPILTACHLVTALQSIPARNLRAVDVAVVSVTKMEAGTAYNVIPDEVTIRGTVRWFGKDVIRIVRGNIQRISESVASAFGASAEVQFRTIFEPLINTPESASFAGDVAAEISGEDSVNRRRDLIMASEDFAFMLYKVPGAYIHYGNGPGAGLHSPNYEFNDSALTYAAAMYARLVERRLAISP